MLGAFWIAVRYFCSYRWANQQRLDCCNIAFLSQQNTSRYDYCWCRAVSIWFHLALYGLVGTSRGCERSLQSNHQWEDQPSRSNRNNKQWILFIYVFLIFNVFWYLYWYRTYSNKSPVKRQIFANENQKNVRLLTAKLRLRFTILKPCLEGA